MPTVSLALPQTPYSVIIENDCLAQCGQLIRQENITGHLAVISDTHVAPLYGQQVLKSLQKAGYTASLITVPAGEASKNMDQVAQLCDQLAQQGFDRKSTLIALGGGVIGDLTGFVSAIYYRGIPFVQIPTTIVAQVDSSVGGKTGVNLPSGKNLIGAFHHPKLVIADPKTLASLPIKVLIEGLSEIIKHAIIRDESMLLSLEKIADTLHSPLSEVTDTLFWSDLCTLIADNVAIKARIVQADEKETLGIRALLNFGHTLGHGIEAAVPYGKLLHGECVSLGIRAALFLSVTHAELPQKEASRVLALMEKLQLPLVLPSFVDPQQALHKVSADKKFEAGAIRFVLTQKLGSAYLDKQLTSLDMASAMQELQTPISL